MNIEKKNLKGVATIRFLFILLLISCHQSNGDSEDVTNVFKNQPTFLKYYNSLKLSEDFTPLDDSSRAINKRQFLQKIISGEYFPLRHTSHDSVYYKLYKVDTPTKDMIWIKDLANTEYNHYIMEGTTLPKFHFVDLNGNIYDDKTTKGKIVVFNFWFIGCTACVKEMPELNRIVDQYKKRNDIVFLSLAFNKKDDLKRFLTKTKFNYATASVSQDYVMNDLSITSFPTQLIISREGKIAKVLNKYQDMEIELRKLASEK